MAVRRHHDEIDVPDGHLPADRLGRRRGKDDRFDDGVLVKPGRDTCQIGPRGVSGVYPLVCWASRRVLRDRYRQTRDLFGAQELARLSFERWLYDSGRLVP